MLAIKENEHVSDHIIVYMDDIIGIEKITKDGQTLEGMVTTVVKKLQNEVTFTISEEKSRDFNRENIHECIYLGHRFGIFDEKSIIRDLKLEILHGNWNKIRYTLSNIRITEEIFNDILLTINDAFGINKSRVIFTDEDTDIEFIFGSGFRTLMGVRIKRFLDDKANGIVSDQYLEHVFRNTCARFRHQDINLKKIANPMLGVIMREPLKINLNAADIAVFHGMDRLQRLINGEVVFDEAKALELIEKMSPGRFSFAKTELNDMTYYSIKLNKNPGINILDLTVPGIFRRSNINFSFNDNPLTACQKLILRPRGLVKSKSGFTEVSKFLTTLIMVSYVRHGFKTE